MPEADQDQQPRPLWEDVQAGASSDQLHGRSWADAQLPAPALMGAKP
jgi:hypothetical protein